MTGLRKSVSAAVLGLLWVAACGGGTSSPAPGTPPDQASSSLTPLRSSAGVSPKASSVSGNHLLIIVNRDSAPHQLATIPDLHPLNCPELNSLIYAPGDQFMAAAIANRNGTCEFIDILILLTRASRARSR